MKKILAIAVLSAVSLSTVSAGENNCPGIKKYGDKSGQICNMVNMVCVSGNNNPNPTSYFDEENPLLVKYEEYKHFEEILSEKEGIFNLSNIDDLKEPFKDLQLTYKTNMSSIYDCGTGKTRISALKSIKKEIESSPLISKKIGKGIDKEIKAIEKNLQNCNFKDNGKQISENILNASTYEMCKYVVNLSYLNSEYYQDLTSYSKFGYEEHIEKLSPKEKEKYKDIGKVSSAALARISSGLSNELYEEIAHTKDVYSKAFASYQEYELNYKSHKYLELLKADLEIYRDELAKTLKPLNQFVYAVLNAMNSK